MRIHLYSVHGLFRGGDLELGRDSDNGGQIIYVMELAKELSRRADVEFVHLFTRRIDDKAVSPDYAVEIEPINDKFDIRRIWCGGKKYLPKEQLWPHLDEFVSNSIKHIKSHRIFPDWIHSHYADAGYVCLELSSYLHVPFAHSAHSLGRAKLEKLTAAGMDHDEAYEKYCFERRFNAEDEALANAEFTVTSTEQEIELFREYEHFNHSEYHVLPPGINFTRYYPYYHNLMEDVDHQKRESALQARHTAMERMDLFLSEPNKPIILAICRPDRRKNINGLIHAYGTDNELRALANLAIFAGIRKDISEMPEGEKEVLTELLLLMDKYDLYGKLAIPKRHDADSVPEIYRLCASRKGVFANVAHTEQFGLTLLEATACGLPVVATDHGGPVEIIPKCHNGILINSRDTPGIQKALKSILTDPQLWTEYSNTGIQRLHEHYSWPAHVDKYLELVTENRKASKGYGIKNISKIPKVQKRLKTAEHMIFTDVDGTLISETGDYAGLEEVKALLSGREDRFIFGIATGRSLDLLRQVIDEFDLPVPDITIASVGTYIYYGMDHELRDKTWEQHIAYRWERDEICDIAAKIPGLELQDEASQNPYKASFFLHEDEFNMEALQQALGPILRRVNVVVTHEHFLDILPKRASKGRAIRYLAHKWSIPLPQTIACGHSGNDFDVFTGTTRGIIVSNHTPDLEPLRSTRRVYFASQPSAAGLVEGLRHFNFS